VVSPHDVARLLLDPKTVEQESRVTYQLKVTLTECDPLIWRRILVPSGYTLRQLHGAIQASMGWQNCHQHSFEIQGVEYGDDPEQELGFQDDGGVTLLRALPPVESAFEYVYDFGDHWVHEVIVEKQLVASEVGTMRFSPHLPIPPV
jgi:Plasmid pRiA4b ORF-3-like protein